jgi:hypothetical protein
MKKLVLAYRIDSDHAVLLVLLGASLAFNVYLGARLRASSRAPQALSQAALRKGDKMDPIRVNSLISDEQTLTFGLERPSSLVYVFSPSCPWCKANGDAVNALYEQAKGTYRFVALSTEEDGIGEFVKAHAVGLPTFVLHKNERNGFGPKVPGVPTTLLISNGKVAHVWPGAYLGETKRSIEHELHVALPVVDPPPK